MARGIEPENSGFALRTRPSDHPDTRAKTKTHFPRKNLKFTTSKRGLAAEKTNLIPLDISLQDTAIDSNWLFSANKKYTGPKSLEELAQIKMAELDKKYELCGDLGRKAFKKNLDLQGWIAVQSLECLNQENATEKNSILNLSRAWIKILEKRDDLFSKGAWRPNLNLQYFKLLSNLIKNESNPSRWDDINRILLRRDMLTNQDKAEIFKTIGYIEVKQNQKGAAAAYFQKSLNSASSEEIRAQLGALVVGEDAGAEVAAPMASIASISEEETLYRSTVESFTKSKNLEGVKTGTELLVKFPYGIRSAAISDKISNIYLSLFEATSLITKEATKEIKKSQLEDIRTVMLQAPSGRAAEWSKTFHRKLDYQFSYQLATKALVSLEDSALGGSLLYIAGRCSHFLGKYSEAEKYFSKLLEKHGSYSEAIEVKFLKALLKIRNEKWDEAESDFKKVLESPDNKNFELASMYWLYRVRSKKNMNVEDLYRSIQDKYSLSYYGLKLLAERNSQKIKWEASNLPALKTTIWLTEIEKNSFDRAVKLSQVGWFISAQSEISDILVPLGNEAKVIVAYYFAKFYNYPLAIKLLTEASTSGDLFKSPSVVGLGFPFPYRHLIEASATKNKLDSYLVVSLMRQESAFSLKATSSSQAQGLMQIIGPTAQEIAQDLHYKNFVSSDIYEPKINVEFGTYYLSKVIRQYNGNISLGLAAYNAGPTRLRRFLDARTEVSDWSKLSQEDPWTDFWIEELPWIETNLYVKSILRNAMIYQLLDNKNKDVEIFQPVWKRFTVNN